MTETLSTPSRAARRLPGRALFGLFFAGFVAILTECLPAGLLPEMSATLHTNVALTGQVVTIYALATAIGAIPLSRLTANWQRRNVLMVALAVVLATNAKRSSTGSPGRFGNVTSIHSMVRPASTAEA